MLIYDNPNRHNAKLYSSSLEAVILRPRKKLIWSHVVTQMLLAGGNIH